MNTPHVSTREAREAALKDIKEDSSNTVPLHFITMSPKNVEIPPLDVITLDLLLDLI